MSAVLVGLVALALAVVLQRLLLVGQARQLTARQQAYRFHAIRDELQSLAISGQAQPDSDLYRFLMWTANLAIRNAGTMKLRDIVSLARAVDKETRPYRPFEEMIRSSPKPLQHVAVETFESLTAMLVANDSLVRGGLRFANVAVSTWRLCRPVLIFLVRRADAIAQHIAPSHAEAVQYARKYAGLAGRVAAA